MLGTTRFVDGDCMTFSTCRYYQRNRIVSVGGIGDAVSSRFVSSLAQYFANTYFIHIGGHDLYPTRSSSTLFADMLPTRPRTAIRLLSPVKSLMSTGLVSFGYSMSLPFLQVSRIIDSAFYRIHAGLSSGLCSWRTSTSASVCLWRRSEEGCLPHSSRSIN